MQGAAVRSGGADEARARALAGELQRVTAGLARCGALRVIVYGSFARAQCHAGSDLDLLAVMPESGEPFARRLARIYAAVDPRLPCDILAYTPAELAALAPVSPLVATALREGRVVYTRPEDSGV